MEKMWSLLSIPGTARLQLEIQLKLRVHALRSPNRAQATVSTITSSIFVLKKCDSSILPTTDITIDKRAHEIPN